MVGAGSGRQCERCYREPLRDLGRSVICPDWRGQGQKQVQGGQLGDCLSGPEEHGGILD